MTGRLFYWVANWSLTRAQASLLLNNKVVDMVDCTHAAFNSVRVCFHAVGAVGLYVTGTPDIRATPEDIQTARTTFPFPQLFEIDQSNTDLPIISDVREVVKDDEAGASSIATSITVAKQRLSRGDDYIIYVSQDSLSAVEGAARHAGLPHGVIIAYQWASPTSNPNTVLPGTNIKLRDAPADLSVIDLSLIRPPGKQAVTDRALVYYDGGKQGDPIQSAVIDYDPDVHGWGIEKNHGVGNWSISPTTPGTGRA